MTEKRTTISSIFNYETKKEIYSEVHIMSLKTLMYRIIRLTCFQKKKRKIGAQHKCLVRKSDGSATNSTYYGFLITRFGPGMTTTPLGVSTDQDGPVRKSSEIHSDRNNSPGPRF